MKAYYLNKLRTRIHEGISVKVYPKYLIVEVDHPKLFNRYSIPVEDATYLKHDTAKRIIHEIMQAEVITFRKTRQHISNLGWWLAIIMGIIFCVWLSK